MILNFETPRIGVHLNGLAHYSGHDVHGQESGILLRMGEVIPGVPYTRICSSHQ